MVKDAEANAAADKEKSSQIEIKNKSEALCYQTKKQLEELGDACSSEDKQKIEESVSKLEDAIKAESYDTMKEISENLEKAIMEVGQKAYAATNNESTGGDDPIDTNFSEEK
jgi:molecular chaperone DnaK